MRVQNPMAKKPPWSQWLEPVDEKIFSGLGSEANDYGHVLYAHGRHFTTEDELDLLPKADIVLLGITEHRGGLQAAGTAKAANAVRQHFYCLKPQQAHCRIWDMGNLKPTASVQESHERLAQLCAWLMQQGMVVLLLGGTHDNMYAQYKSFTCDEQMITVANIDAHIDLAADPHPLDRHHLYVLMMHQPTCLFEFVQLAHQTYLNSPRILEAMEKMSFPLLSLGQMRQDFLQVEPLIRAAHMVSFDMSALNRQAIGDQAAGQLFGLTGEEACHLCWFAGLSPLVRSLGLYGFDAGRPGCAQGAFLMAVMLWYFIDGFYRRRPVDFSSPDMLHYRVAIGKGARAHVLDFYKQRSTEMWWVAVPYSQDKLIDTPYYLPCSYKDYLHALEGDLPDRWIQTSAKLL